MCPHQKTNRIILHSLLVSGVLKTLLISNWKQRLTWPMLYFMKTKSINHLLAKTSKIFLEKRVRHKKRTLLNHIHLSSQQKSGCDCHIFRRGYLYIFIRRFHYLNWMLQHRLYYHGIVCNPNSFLNIIFF